MGSRIFRITLLLLDSRFRIVALLRLHLRTLTVALVTDWPPRECIAARSKWPGFGRFWGCFDFGENGNVALTRNGSAPSI